MPFVAAAHHLRAGLLRRLLRGLARDAGAAFAADGVTNAISSVIIVGALLASGPQADSAQPGLGLHRRGAGRGEHLRRLPRDHRMLSMFKKKPVKKQGEQVM
jgi:hypothetical protein